MKEDSANVSSNTWFRAVEPINKAGFMEGAADGQSATFQTSFNIGYETGLNFGLQLGLNEALRSKFNEKERKEHNTTTRFLKDPRRINCQLCMFGDKIKEKTDTLFREQELKNDEFLQITSLE